VHDPSALTTVLFTDIEGSTRLWDQEPERMRPALEQHDALARAAVEGNHGTIVKMTGDGLYATFADSLDALAAALQLQLALADTAATGGVALRVRCGLHAGEVDRRDNDYFGSAVNRAARIMGAAHGGQIILSQAVADRIADRLPQAVALRDLGTVRLRDLAHPERVYQVVHPELRRDFPALRSLEATPNNLPQQLSSFVGRERVLAEVKHLLGNTRLLTLVGVGGLGKTRLSLQLAADVMDSFPDGVWLVELASLSDPQLVPQAVASVLGVKEEAGRPVQEALTAFVRDRQLLVVLDNCEHMVHACAELARQLLQSGSRVKIITSSREHLHVAGETTYPMPTLAVPGAQLPVSVDDLAQYEAVRLFVDRAVAAQPAFRLTGQNATAVADICHRLDGIPLAIELAAARVRAMPAEKIAERLGDRFRLLTDGDRTALPRQQTLRALIDWSYELLTGRERVLFRQLAVFAGGFTLEAAEAIGAEGQVDGKAALSSLTNLVEKSLVVLDPDGGRYRMLETVRQYAQERLAESSEADVARTRHVAFFVALAEQARPELVGPRQAEWLARLDAERENLLAAHASCDGAEGNAEAGLRLLPAIKHYWFNRGLLALGYRLMAEALARPGTQARNLVRCRGLFDAGQFCCAMGHYTEAQPLLEESLAIAREIGDKARVAMTLQPLHEAALGQGDRDAAWRFAEEAVALARELPDRRELAAALTALAQMNRLDGRLDAAEPLYDQAVVLVRELGDRESIAIGLLNLGMVAIGRGAHDRARSMLLEALAIAEESGSKPVGQSVLEVSAGLAASLRRWDAAARFYGVAEAQAGETGQHRDHADEAFLAPHIATAREALGAGAFAGAEAGGRALAYPAAMKEARAWLERAR